MPTIPPAVMAVLTSLAIVFAFGVLLSLARRRLGIDPVERAAAAIDSALPRMPAVEATAGAA